MKKLIFLFLTIVFISQYTVAQVPSYVPTDGLLGYWPFSGNANDESGNENNGVVNGAILTEDRFGDPMNSYLFSREQDQDISISATPLLNNISNITISLWVNLNSYGEEGGSGYNHYINKTSQTDLPDGFVFANNNTQLYFYHGDGANFYFTNDLPVLNEWSNLVVSYNYDETTSENSYCKFYINGLLRGETQTSQELGDAAANILIGKYTTNSYDRLDGKIDDIGIWNRALTQEEITTLYESEVLSTNIATNESNINIYPNPANDQITVDFGNLNNVEDWNIKIINILGQEVLSQPMNTDKINVSELSKGVYIVRISDGVNQADKKFIKN
jgi:hypothetical protein